VVAMMFGVLPSRTLRALDAADKQSFHAIVRAAAPSAI
jgi:hypothetical protein